MRSRPTQLSSGNSSVPSVEAWWWLVCALVSALAVVLISSPACLSFLGIRSYGLRFFDFYAVLASNDAVVAGMDPYLPNPLDPFHRTHSYPSWWLGLHHLGLGRADGQWLGWLLCLGFLVVASVQLKPRTKGALVSMALVLGCPPVLLALNRANNDLVIFLLLAPVPWLLLQARAWLRFLPAVLVVLATGLKYYPCVAALSLAALPDRVERRRVLLVFGVLALVAGITLWPDLMRQSYAEVKPGNLYSFGSQVAPVLLQWTSPLVRLLTFGLGAVAFVAGFLVPIRGGEGAAQPDRESLLFAQGSLLLCGCFWMNLNFSYRLVFLVWLMPLLCRAIEYGENPARRLARWGLALVLVFAWGDAFIYVGISRLVIPFLHQEPLPWENALRLAGQVPVWALFLGLAGWLGWFTRRHVASPNSS